jgi:phosphoglycolate phosphatase-like HAD superfamily hydrolase
MIWTAVMATGTPAMSDVLVVGDTTSDMESGRRSGARWVIGVLTGTHDRAALTAAGATVVVDSIAEIPTLQ